MYDIPPVSEIALRDANMLDSSIKLKNLSPAGKAALVLGK
jgi:hypothetical protein